MGSLLNPRPLVRRSLWGIMGLLATFLCLASTLVLATPAFAQESATPTPEPVAPDLAIEWSWPTAILTFGLVAVFYILVFWLSEKEFKGVIAERFGPKK